MESATGAAQRAAVNPGHLFKLALERVKQKDSVSCGPAAVASVLETSDQDTLAAELGTTFEDGTDQVSIVKALRDRGLEAELRKGMTVQELGQCLELGHSVIVNLQDLETDPGGFENGHYVIALRHGPDGFVFLDPKTGKQSRAVSPGELVARWHSLDESKNALHGAAIVVAHQDVKPENVRSGELFKRAAQELQPHQKRVAERLKDVPGLLVIHGLGSGKTRSSLNAAQELGLPLLAIVPASLRQNYLREMELFGFKGPAMVLSYEQALAMKDDPEFRQYAADSLTVYDEASRISREGSLRSELPNILPARKKILLSATPARNSPAELGKLLEAASGGELPAGMINEHLVRRRTSPGLWGWLTGEKPVTEEAPKDLPAFAEKARKYVDAYEAKDRSDYPEVVESTVEVPLSSRQHSLYNYMMASNPGFWQKIRSGIAPEKSEVDRLRAFMNGPRQLSNSASGFTRKWAPEDDSKINAMADALEERYRKDKNFRGVSYSSFVGAGIKPLSAELTRRGIPHGVFTGEQNDAEKKRLVDAYNTPGEKGLPVLLLSGAGAEGISLKRTKLLQVGESSWSDSHTRQVVGRAVRFKSHEDLPKDQRVVEVQKFRSKIPKTFMQRLLGLDPDKSADEYVADIAEGKNRLTESFVGALKTGTMFGFARSKLRELPATPH